MINIVIAVFLGGAVGAVLREVLMLTVGIVRDGFPLDLFIANVVAAFLLGLAASAHARGRLGDHVYALVGTGVMGGLSTFSSFALAAVQLIQHGQAATALVFVVASVVAGYAAVMLGLRLGQDRPAATKH
jgi:CrcB protein